MQYYTQGISRPSLYTIADADNQPLDELAWNRLFE